MGKSENLGFLLKLSAWRLIINLQIALELMSSQSGSEFVEYDSECYEVECIRDRRIFKGKKQYFIKWKDWDEKYNTWQPIENLQTVLGMVNAFEREYEQGNSKKDSNLKQSQASEASLKKTKPIEKQKKKKKSNEEIQQSQSEGDVVQIPQMKEKKIKKDEGKKSASIYNNNEMQVEKEKGGDKVLVREKEVEKQKLTKDTKQKQKERQKQKQKQVPIIKKSESSSIVNINKAPQPPTAVNLSKQVSKSVSEPYSGDIIQITGINYHILIPPELPHLPAKLYYNVDRRNKITKKPVAVIDMPSEELLHKCPQKIIRYLQSFAIEVEYYSYQKRQYQGRRNAHDQVQNSNVLGQK